MFPLIDKMLNENPNYYVERLSAIFIFTLIISGNYIGELFPCKIQRILTNNMMIKHFFGFITLFFFGVIAVPELNNLYGLLSSGVLYLIFLINAKTNYKVWIGVLILYALLYLVNIVKKSIEENIDNKSIHTSFLPNWVENENAIKILQGVEWIGLILILLSTVFGFVIYVGEKKIEYGNKFSWGTFFTGKPNCKHKTPKNLSYEEVLTAAGKAMLSK